MSDEHPPELEIDLKLDKDLDINQVSNKITLLSNSSVTKCNTEIEKRDRERDSYRGLFYF